MVWVPVNVRTHRASRTPSIPTDEVSYPTLIPALGLVTCGGQFDDSTGHYRSNIIVYATLGT
jgi:hypothetical protein